MRYEEFSSIVIPGKTCVVVPKKALKMDEGWDQAMDSMVGVPLLVREKLAESVTLTANDGGCYSFGYKYIELANHKRSEVYLGDYKFLISEEVSYHRIKESLLRVDIEKLFNTKLRILPRTHMIKITSDHLEQIQTKCPRVIGALLSNNIMERII